MPRHTVLVRLTHWINALVFLALVISGAAILLAHPRLYWGETGAFGSPALIELPLPLDLEQSGWGRSLHFLAAWLCVVNGSAYLLSRPKPGRFAPYTPPQRFAYAAVVFILFPLMIATGLAMSPAVGAAVPALVGVLGGYQSARTIHFAVTSALVLFVAGHIAMVYVSGFRERMRDMTIGGVEVKEPS